MKRIDIIRLSAQTFRQRRLRTFLTVSGVIIGIGAIVFLVSLGYGLQNLTTSEIAAADALRMLNVTQGGSKIIELNADIITQFEAIEKVQSVSPRQSFSARLKYGGSASDGVINGVKPEHQKIEGIEIINGTSLTTKSQGEIIVSQMFLNLFGLKQADEAIGQEVEVEIFVPQTAEDGTGQQFARITKKFKITGFTPEEDSLNLYTSLADLEDLGVAAYNSVRIIVENPQDLNGVREIVEQRGFTVEAPADTLQEVTAVFRVVRIILAIFGVIALFVASIGMFNTLTISLLERTRDIGIMKAIGASDRDIRRIFLYESLAIALFGGIMGVLVGWGMGKIINLIINILAQTLGGEIINLFSTPLIFTGSMIIISLVVGFITGIYPAWRASKLDPLIALRYE